MAPSATLITDGLGKQYHIQCAVGDVAEYIMLVGDPKRAERTAERFERIDKTMAHREFLTFTGTYLGTKLSVMATGIGPDNTEIALIELCQITKNPTFIRCGTCSTIRKDVNLGGLAISKAALRMDATTDYFVPRGYPAAGDSDVMLALAMAAQKLGQSYHVGVTASAPGFYGAQGRDIPGFPNRSANLIKKLSNMHVLNIEMETGALFTLSLLRGVRAGAVCAVFGNRLNDQFLTEDDRKSAESNAIDVSLNAFQILKKMDKQKIDRQIPMWIPEEI